MTAAQDPLVDDLREALSPQAEPEQLDAFHFARGILPAFELVRALFSQSPVDTCSKLMLLFELSPAGGRSTIERIHSLAPYFDRDRVDALVRSLKDGGWFELRAIDHSYALSALG